MSYDYSEVNFMKKKRIILLILCLFLLVGCSNNVNNNENNNLNNNNNDVVEENISLKDPIVEWCELYNPNGFDTITCVISNPNKVDIDFTNVIYVNNRFMTSPFSKYGQEVKNVHIIMMLQKKT